MKILQMVLRNDWLALEKQAREAQVGLWEDENPQPPWEWRSEHRSKKIGGVGFGDNISVVTSSTVAAGARSSIVYHGNRRNHVFHGPSCREYNCKNCTVIFGSYQDAEGAGYRAHRGCVSE